MSSIFILLPRKILFVTKNYGNIFKNSNKRKKQKLTSPDARESRLLGRDGMVAGKWKPNKSQTIRSKR
jgi:hypothetical protein